MKFRKPIALAAALLMTISAGASAYAETVTASAVPKSYTVGTYNGYCGPNAYWSINGNTLTISGTGDMYSFYDSYSVPWTGYSSTIRYVTIQSGITSISAYAFLNCSNLQSVSIPGTVKRIGAYAFQSCTSLKNVSIPNSVTSIGEYCFNNCTSLYTVHVGTGANIPDYCFRGCTSLRAITLMKPAITFGNNAFYGTSLTHVHIPYNANVLYFLGKSGLPSYQGYYFVLSSAGKCPATTCPMGINGGSTPTPTPTPTPATKASPKINYTNIGNRKVVLKWPAVSGATQYNVYMSHGGNVILAGTTKSTSLKLNNLTNGQTYKFKVKALVSGKDTSGDYYCAGLVPKNYGIKVKAVAGVNRVSLSWNKLAAANKYQVVCRLGNQVIRYWTQTTTTATFTGLASGKDYSFYVIPYIKNKLISFDVNDVEDKIYVTHCKPLISPKITSYVRGRGAVKIRYNAITGATKYRIYYVYNGTEHFVGTTTDTEYTITGLKRNAPYKFYVRAVVKEQTTQQKYMTAISTL